MATYCTRIYIKVDEKALMEKLCTIDVSDLGKGFYKAKNIFDASSVESNFYDSESAINENDLTELVERVVAVIKGHGTILADTYSYDYDPFPQVCYYNGEEIISKQIELDGYTFVNMAEITDISAWVQFVENVDGYNDNCGEDGYEASDFWDAEPMVMDEETLRDIYGIVPDENGFAFKDYGDDGVTLYNYFGNESIITIPKNINELAAGCFAGNEIIEEVTLPDSVKAMDMGCFGNCPNLQKVYTSANLTEFGCDNSSFSQCPNLTLYAPAGSETETYARENNIKFETI